jgi:hypothetical protein
LLDGMASSSRLSPGAAIGMGVGFGAMGTLIMLVALGAVGELRPTDAPPWVVFCAGLVFALAGLAVIVGYGVAPGVTADGDLAPDTPTSVRVVQYTLGLGITVGLSLVTTWVAFGPGPRSFSGTGPLGSGPVGEVVGRAWFGAGAVLLWAFTVAVAVTSVIRLRRRPRRP